MSNKIHVLHVDDEPDFAEMSAALLEQEDDRIAVQCATSANEGIKLLDEIDFDCVISDYDMPQRNGIEFLEFVRNRYSDLPFILFTGKGSEEVASQAVSAGVTDYLQKTSGRECYTLLRNRILNAVEHYKTAKQLKRTKQLRKELTRLSIDVLSTENIDMEDQIDHALEKIGSLANADRSYVFEINEEASTTDNTYEWCAAGVEPQIDALQGIPLNAIPWWMEKLRARETINIPLVAELPPEAKNERGILEEQHIVSVVVVPMVSDGDLTGFIGFDWLDHQEVSEDFTEILEMVGHLVTTILEREKREQQLRERSRQLEGVLDNVEAAIWMRDTDSRYILMNQNYRQLFGIGEQTAVRGKRPADLLSAESASKFRENDRMAMKQKEPIEVERTFDTADGEETYLARITPLFDDGELYAICGVASAIEKRIETIC